MKTRVAKVCSLEGDASSTSCGKTSVLAVFSRLTRKFGRQKGAMRYYWGFIGSLWAGFVTERSGAVGFRV